MKKESAITQPLPQPQDQLVADLAQAQLLQDISTQLIHEDCVEVLYEKIVDAAVRIMGSDYGTMQRLYPERGKNGELRLLAFRGLTAEQAQEWTWVSAESATTCGATLRLGKRIIVPDVHHCDFMAGTDAQTALLRAGIQAGQSTPLISRSGQLVGMISTHWSKPHMPSEQNIRLIDVLARQAADLIERTQTELRLRKNEEQLRTLTAELEHLVEERTRELMRAQDRLRDLAAELTLAEQRERQRLAGELHDHLQQLLVLAKLNLGQVLRLPDPMPAPASANLIKTTDDVLSEALKYTRSLVAELSPPVLHEYGLTSALKWLGEYMQRHGMKIAVQVIEQSDVHLPEDQAVLLYQSVRELLINASKYAESHEAVVSLEQVSGELRIEVRDHGKGFEPALVLVPAPGSSSKFGLFSIRERMKALGGDFEVESAPGKGTRATLSLPLRQSGHTRKQAINPPVFGHDSRLTNSQTRTPGPIRVLLVDDHAMVRQGLRSVLESYSDVEIVGEAGDGAEAVTMAEQLRPAIVVMDIHMPTMNGIEATSAIKTRFPDILVIGLSVQLGYECEQAMRKAGAAILLTKESAVDALYQAIQLLLKVSFATSTVRSLAMDAIPRHQCLIYDGSPAPNLPRLAELIAKKLNDNIRCLYLNSPAMVAGMQSYLYAAGVDVGQEITKGRLVMSSDQDNLVNGRFDIDLMLTRLDNALDKALNDGYLSLFATGDMSWEFGPEKDFSKLLEYEWRLEEFLSKRPALSGICQYHTDTLPREVVRQGLLSHHSIFISGTLSRLNPHYLAGRSLPGQANDADLDDLITLLCTPHDMK